MEWFQSKSKPKSTENLLQDLEIVIYRIPVSGLTELYFLYICKTGENMQSSPL